MSSKSESHLVQKEAICGLASLAATDEQIKDAIVEGPLRIVVGLMVDPNSDKELRKAAEQVLKATGFDGGENDFQMCSYDYQILRDWFMLKRSLKPQALGHRMVRMRNAFKLGPIDNSSKNTYPSNNNAK